MKIRVKVRVNRRKKGEEKDQGINVELDVEEDSLWIFEVPELDSLHFVFYRPHYRHLEHLEAAHTLLLPFPPPHHLHL